MIRKTKLSSGLRVITLPFKNSQTVTVLVLVGVGSRYESRHLNGISHFLEHTYFKGTKKQPNAKAVAETLDRIGGVYNAFTGEEYTGYYAKVASSHFNIALEWVADILLNSKIPAKEITKEKGVIIEEINMIKDHPLSYIHKVWSSLLYGDQPAGWGVIGTKESVSAITRKDLVDYMNQGYTAEGTVVCVAGNVSVKEVEKKTEQYFSGISGGPELKRPPVIEKQLKPAILVEERNTDQTHLCLGVRAYNLFHPQYYTLDIMETILGKMMSSRLFVKIREKLGLAYYIMTEYEACTDSGFLVTQAGVDNNKVVQATAAILKEYQKLSHYRVSESELTKAKENIKGKIAISLESSDLNASFYGTQELLKKEIITVDKLYQRLDKVTANDILKTAQDIFQPAKLNLAIIGPVPKDNLEKILTI